MSEFKFNPAQIDELNRITDFNTKNFHQGYSYVYDLIKYSNDVSASQKYWLEQAIQINANDPSSASNIFIRAVTKHGLGV